MIKGRPVVAIVDGDPATRKSTETLLCSFGFNTEQYGSAAEFIEASAATQACCLLLAIEFGDLSGLEPARYLLKAGMIMPTVYVSAVKNDIVQRAATELGCVAFLEKPVDSTHLIEAIVAATKSKPVFKK